MKPHTKKLIASILITAIMIIYYAVYFGFLISLVNGIWNCVLGIFPLLFAAVMVKVCIDRIKEIRSGEEDDLSQY